MSNKTQWGMTIPKSYVVLDAAGGVYWRDEESGLPHYAPMKDDGSIAWEDGGELDSRVDDELDRAANLTVDLLDVLIRTHKAWMDEYNDRYGPKSS